MSTAAAARVENLLGACARLAVLPQFAALPQFVGPAPPSSPAPAVFEQGSAAAHRARYLVTCPELRPVCLFLHHWRMFVESWTEVQATDRGSYISRGYRAGRGSPISAPSEAPEARVFPSPATLWGHRADGGRGPPQMAACPSPTQASTADRALSFPSTRDAAVSAAAFPSSAACSCAPRALPARRVVIAPLETYWSGSTHRGPCRSPVAHAARILVQTVARLREVPDAGPGRAHRYRACPGLPD